MKKFNLLLLILIISIVIGCKKDNKEDTPTQTTENIVPTSIYIDIPTALNSVQKSNSSKGDTLSGNDIYRNLRTFINVGETSAKTINEIMLVIRLNNINRPMSFTFTSKDDGRVKKVDVIENGDFNGTKFKYKMLIADIDGSKALELFWNVKPVSAIAIMQLYNINRKIDQRYKDVLYKIDYNEELTTYEKQMVISLTKLPKFDKGSIDNMKMFVGKKGTTLDIYGNSNHPYLTLVDTNFTGGRNYAFVAHANDALNIGVAILCMPPSATATNNNILTDYSIEKVLTDEIRAVYPNVTQQMLNSYLKNTKAPGYFTNGGFVSCGTNIPNIQGFTTDFLNLTGLNPYIPNDIKNLTISFSRN